MWKMGFLPDICRNILGFQEYCLPSETIENQITLQIVPKSQSTVCKVPKEMPLI